MLRPRAAVLVLVNVFFGAVAWAALQAPASDGPVKLVFLHTNDIHGQVLPRDARGRQGEKVGGVAALDAAIVKERTAAAAAGAHCLLVDSGDWYQGTPEGNFAKDNIPGALVVDWMNATRFDAAAIGNHEFDFGVDNVKALIARAKFPCLGANVLQSSKPLGRPYVVLERGGVKIGVIGLLTNDTPRMVAEGRLGDVKIPDHLDAGRAWFDRVKKESDFVVFLTHCGKDEDEKLARRVPETPVIFGGHSHTKVNQPSSVDHEPAALAVNVWDDSLRPRTFITQSGSKTENLDRVELWVDPKSKKIVKVDTKIYELNHKTTGEHPATLEWIAKETAAVAKDLDQTAATLTAPPEVAVKGRRGDPTANFMTDAMLWSAKRVDPKCVAAFGNGGGVRAKVATGPLTRRNIYEIVPFDNTVVLLTLSGEALHELVKESMSGSRDGNLLAAGLTGAVAKRPDGAFDLADLRIAGAPIDVKASYRVAANSFIADGKGGLSKFLLGTDKKDTGQLVRDALLDYALDRKTIALDDVLRLRFDRDAK
jgi:5'-nucleotidase